MAVPGGSAAEFKPQRTARKRLSMWHRLMLTIEVAHTDTRSW